MGGKPKASSLEKYRQKRDPGRTNEPFAPEPLASGPTWGGVFVVHEHDATAKHYDLRLEVSGALKSFAVPRGPSLDPKDKRLAVQTEDHPLEYADYEGVIPEDNYGAGPMIAWDMGRVRYLENDAESGIAKGKIDFELYGHKLRGRFALVLTSGRKGEKVRQPQWLLLKKTDPHARPGEDVLQQARSVLSGLTIHELLQADALGAQLEQRAAELGAPRQVLEGRRLTPMACALQGAPLQSDDWIYELKLDGVRILAEKRDDDVALFYRKGRSAIDSYPEVARGLRALAARRVVLDGEIVAFDEEGKPDFQRLARRFRTLKPREVQRVLREVPVVYLAFDVLAVGDHDLTRVPLIERKRLLSEVVPGKGLVRALDHIERDGRALYTFCRQQRLEGVIAKRRESTYQQGPRRSNDWVKLKCEREDDFVIVGWTGSRNNKRQLGALDLATYEGDQLVSRGKVGSGFDDATLDMLREELAKRRVQKTDVSGSMVKATHGRTFVRPELVANVRYLGFTDAGHLRHPVYQGLRVDVAPRDCQAMPQQARARVAEQQQPVPDPAPKPAAGKLRFKVTNADKVFWPAEGYTKGDLCRYYEGIAPALLPFLKERPIILVRYPDGIEGKSFYQWNAPDGTPSWVRTVNVRWQDRRNKEVQLFLADDVDTLVYLAQLGCIPVHILAARIGALSTCDFLTIDFDLGEQPFRVAIELARELKGLLDEMGLAGFPKTSGQTGLHVLVPLGPGVSFDTARALCELLGTIVTARHRDVATMERSKAKRGGRAYVDTGQTGTIRAIVAPYSVRAYPGARVSTPLHWDEVSFALDPARFTMMTVVDRVLDHGDPWHGMLESAPDIPSAVQALSRYLPKG